MQPVLLATGNRPIGLMARLLLDNFRGQMVPCMPVAQLCPDHSHNDNQYNYIGMYPKATEHLLRCTRATAKQICALEGHHQSHRKQDIPTKMSAWRTRAELGVRSHCTVLPVGGSRGPAKNQDATSAGAVNHPVCASPRLDGH